MTAVKRRNATLEHTNIIWLAGGLVVGWDETGGGLGCAGMTGIIA